MGLWWGIIFESASRLSSNAVALDLGTAWSWHCVGRGQGHPTCTGQPHDKGTLAQNVNSATKEERKPCPSHTPGSRREKALE